MGDWGKAEERLVVRAVDVLGGVLSGAAPEPVREIIASRVLLEIEQLLFPAHEELVLVENCQGAAQDVVADQWEDEAAVRRWLGEVLRQHAGAYNDHHDLYPGDWYHADPEDHPIWTLLGLSPLARRLRLLQDATAQTGAALGRAIGVGAHQVGHWAADRSRPGSGERAALAEAFGVHPGWLDAARDQEADVQLYRFGQCPCEKPGAVTRGDLGREEPDWFDSAAEQAAAVRWCDGCGQPWLRDSAGFLLPLPPGEEEGPANGTRVDGSPPADDLYRRTLAMAWPAALWRAPHHPARPPRGRIAYPVPALLVAAPKALAPPREPAAPAPLPHYIRPDERVAAYADRCPTCRDLLDAPAEPAGGPWVLLHRSKRPRSLSTWSYPSQLAALHAAAHMAMVTIGGDRVARDLFGGQAHEQVLRRFWELHPDTDLFEVAELVPQRSTDF